MSVLIYDLDVLGGGSDVLCTCLHSGGSHWCLIWISGMLSRSPSHIWGRLYLPIFLFTVGLLTLLYLDSLAVLAKSCPSLSTMLKFSMVIRWPVVFWWRCIGQGTLRCSLYPTITP